MSFMDVPEISCVLAEAYRVLRPGGFLQFSIEHPCFATTYSRNLRDERGISYAREVGDYFLDTKARSPSGSFSAAPEKMKKGLPKFETPRFHQTVSRWLNLLIEAGFLLERAEEPQPSEKAVVACPHVQPARIFAYFLHVRVRKPR